MAKLGINIRHTSAGHIGKNYNNLGFQPTRCRQGTSMSWDISGQQILNSERRICLRLSEIGLDAVSDAVRHRHLLGTGQLLVP